MAHIFLCFLLILAQFTYSYHFPSSFTNNDTIDWIFAEQYCVENYNSHLVSIHSDSELQQIKTEIIALNVQTQNFYIGLSYINDGTNINHYSWSDGSQFTFGSDSIFTNYPWRTISNPDDFNTDNNQPKYIYLSGANDLKWSPNNGDEEMYWICSDPPSIEPTLEPTIHPTSSPITPTEKLSINSQTPKPTLSPSNPSTNDVDTEIYLQLMGIISFDVVNVTVSSEINGKIEDIMKSVMDRLGDTYCLYSYDYDLNITIQDTNVATIQITFNLDICSDYNEAEESELIMDIKNSLQTDFINTVNNESIDINTDSLHISVTAIETDRDENDDNNNLSESSSNSTPPIPLPVMLIIVMIIVLCLCILSCLFTMFINKHELSIQQKRTPSISISKSKELPLSKSHAKQEKNRDIKLQNRWKNKDIQLQESSPPKSISKRSYLSSSNNTSSVVSSNDIDLTIKLPDSNPKIRDKILTISQSVEHTITPSKAKSFEIRRSSPNDRGSDTEMTEDLSDLISPSSETPSGFNNGTPSSSASANGRFRFRDGGLSPFQMPNNGMIDIIIERHEEDSVEELFDPKQSKRHLRHSTMGSELAGAIARAKKQGKRTISNEGLSDIDIEYWMNSQSDGSPIKDKKRDSGLLQTANV